MVALRKGIDALRKPLFQAIRILNSLGMVILVIMVLLLVADIILRRVFNNPLPWSLEVVKIMLVVIVFFAVAYCGTRGGHISIDVLTSRFPPKARAILYPIISFFGVGLFAFIAWGSSTHAMRLWETHRVTGILPIPIYPFVFVVTLGSALLALVLLIEFVDSIINAESE
jgi:TRAP-type C4-dicarboxylate transport system permease small subunit